MCIRDSFHPIRFLTFTPIPTLVTPNLITLEPKINDIYRGRYKSRYYKFIIVLFTFLRFTTKYFNIAWTDIILWYIMVYKLSQILQGKDFSLRDILLLMVALLVNLTIANQSCMYLTVNIVKMVGVQ